MADEDNLASPEAAAQLIVIEQKVLVARLKAAGRDTTGAERFATDRGSGYTSPLCAFGCLFLGKRRSRHNNAACGDAVAINLSEIKSRNTSV